MPINLLPKIIHRYPQQRNRRTHVVKTDCPLVSRDSTNPVQFLVSYGVYDDNDNINRVVPRSRGGEEGKHTFLMTLTAFIGRRQRWQQNHNIAAYHPRHQSSHGTYE